MTTEAEIRAADAEYTSYIAGLSRVTGGGPVTRPRSTEERRELLRLLDEARAERDELLAHEKQTHESLGAILGTDDSLETCAKRMRAERDEATAEGRRLRNVLMREGFVPCDIPACNCGGYHHRYGLPERMAEIREELTNAGVLNDETGNLPIRAVQRLVAERDALREPVRLFGELMAVMHSDGGHYHAEHGDQKAYDDAVARWYAVITERDEAMALLGRARWVMDESNCCKWLREHDELRARMLK